MAITFSVYNDTGVSFVPGMPLHISGFDLASNFAFCELKNFHEGFHVKNSV